MCTHPIQIKNPSQYVNLRATAYSYNVPCGRCCECHQDKVNGYVLRAHTEFLNASVKGGYFLFDTLTYAPDHLPSVFGRPCFSHRDITLFRKRVENDLVARGFGRDNTFKFFVTSEFGGDFHRPHYHIGFFVYNPKITPLILDEIINRNWRFFDPDNGKLPFDSLWRYKPARNRDLGLGFTDMSSPYERVFRCPQGVDSTVDAQNVIGYIAGYTVKDDDYRYYHNTVIDELRRCCGKPERGQVLPSGRKLGRFIKKSDYIATSFDTFLERVSNSELLKDYYNDLSLLSTADYALQRERLISSDIEPFIQSSLEFGSSLLDGVKDNEELLADFIDHVFVPDQEKGKKPISTPMYYKKKLFYNNYNEKLVYTPDGYKWLSSKDAKPFEPVLDEDGKPRRRVRSELNELGIKLKSMKIKDRQSRFAKFVSDIVMNTVDADLNITDNYVPKSTSLSNWPKSSFEVLKMFSGRFDAFARYKLLFKDRIFARSVLDTFEGDDVGLLFFVLSNKDSSYIYSNSVLFSKDGLYTPVEALSNLVGEELVRLDDSFCEEWKDFDLMDDVFSFLVFQRGVQKTKLKRERDEKRKAFKNMRVKKHYMLNRSKIA